MEYVKRFCPISQGESDDRLVLPWSRAGNRWDRANVEPRGTNLIAELKQRLHLSIGRIEPGESLEVYSPSVSFGRK